MWRQVLTRWWSRTVCAEFEGFFVLVHAYASIQLLKQALQLGICCRICHGCCVNACSTGDVNCGRRTVLQMMGWWRKTARKFFAQAFCNAFSSVFGRDRQQTLQVLSSLVVVTQQRPRTSTTRQLAIKPSTMSLDLLWDPAGAGEDALITTQLPGQFSDQVKEVASRLSQMFDAETMEQHSMAVANLSKARTQRTPHHLTPCTGNRRHHAMVQTRRP